MPAIVGWIVSGLMWATRGVVGQVLVSLGIAAVTYTGLDLSLGYLKSNAVAAAVGLGPDVVGMLSVLKVGQCISLIFSAILTRMAANGLKNGTLKKWVTK